MEAKRDLYFKTHMNEINATLKNNKISIRGRLGKGGFGEVVKVYSEEYQMEFALKIFPLHINKDITISFQREIDLLSELDHPNIIRIFKEIRDTHFAYIIMELCEKGSLFECIQKNEKLSTNQILAFTQSIAQAISYCHQNGIIHNDIKPQNILIDKYNRAKLTDFGLSKRISDMANNEFGGTMAFIPPEKLFKHYGNPFPADIWSLGVTIYYLATLRLPWYSTNRDGMKKEIEAFSFINIEDIDPDLGKIILALMKREPSCRPTADEVVRMCTSTLHNKVNPGTSLNLILKPYKTTTKTMSLARKSSILKMKSTLGSKMRLAAGSHVVLEPVLDI